MNQILKPEILLSENNDNNLNKKKTFSSYRFYRIQLVISIFIAFCLIVAFLFRIYSINKSEKLSQHLLNMYNVSTLYSTNTEYSSQLLENNSFEYSTPFVIGILKIDKINLNYPILSESNKQLLNISLCRFAGPMPNEIGNLCIAGHNYVDYKFFSRLHELEKNDTIKVYDLNGKLTEYFVYDKYEVEITDTSCTSQDTNGKNIVTLLTCNNVSGKRLVIVAHPVV